VCCVYCLQRNFKTCAAIYYRDAEIFKKGAAVHKHGAEIFKSGAVNFQKWRREFSKVALNKDQAAQLLFFDCRRRILY